MNQQEFNNLMDVPTEYYYTKCKCGNYICAEVTPNVIIRKNNSGKIHFYGQPEEEHFIDIKCEKCIKDPYFQSHLETEDKYNRIKWNKVPYFEAKNEVETEIFDLLSELYSCNKVREDTGKTIDMLDAHIWFVEALLINNLVSYCNEDKRNQSFYYKEFRRNYAKEEIDKIDSYFAKEEGKETPFLKVIRDKRTSHRDKDYHKEIKKYHSQFKELYNDFFEACRILFQYSSKEDMHPQLFNLDIYLFYKNGLLSEPFVYMTDILE